MTTTLPDLLRTVAACPDADLLTACSMLADWLTEHGDPGTLAATLFHVSTDAEHPRGSLRRRVLAGCGYRVCPRCEGDGKAHGSDRPFEWSGPGSYPGPCPVCAGAGLVPPTYHLSSL